MQPWPLEGSVTTTESGKSLVQLEVQPPFDLHTIPTPSTPSLGGFFPWQITPSHWEAAC